MTKRKPPGVSFESWIDEQVRRARDDGLFEDLPGQGRPLEHLAEADDPLWWARRLVQREKLSVLPPALEIRSRVEEGLARLATLAREQEVRSLVEGLNEEIRQLNRRAHAGPPTRQSVLDVEAVVARWRRLRGEATK